MSKLALTALLGMLALAAAVEVVPLKKHEGYEGHHGHEGYGGYDGPGKHDYGVPYGPKPNVEAHHKQWKLYEKPGDIHPCKELYEILGSTVTYHGELHDKDEHPVGNVYWSGIVVKWDECAHCKNYQSTGHHDVKVNYEVIFEFEKEHQGQLIGKVVAGSVNSDDTTVVAILGGTGPFQGAWGTVTWSKVEADVKYMYEFDIYLPKVIEHDYQY